MNRTSHGFTLIELLISLALVGILLTAVVYLNISTSRSAAALQTRNDLLPELQIAQNYMANKLKEASYIFPNPSYVQMSAAGGTSVSPSGSANWQIPTDPIVAFIVPPKTVIPGRCATEGAITNGDVAQYCYAFYAFYAMTRSAYLAAVSGADRPNSDPVNDAISWVLVEYRGYYSSASLNTNSGFLWGSSSIPTSNRGRLLMDYLPPYTGTTKLFTVAGTTANYLTETAGVTTVTINLASQQSVAGQIVRLPNSDTTKFTPLTVYPRNVGKPQLNN